MGMTPRLRAPSLNFLARAKTIAKSLAAHKTWSRAVAHLFPLSFAFPPAGALGMPVTIGAQIPLVSRETYVLEIAKDPGFATIVFTDLVRGRAFRWDAPEEGVFHWRLARPNQVGRGGDVTTFVSGSFVVVDARVQRIEPPRLSWSPIEGADRYKLLVLEESGRTRTLLTSATVFAVGSATGTLVIEIVPLKGEQRIFRDYHYDPSLKFNPGTNPNPNPAPALPKVLPPPSTQAGTPLAKEAVPVIAAEPKAKVPEPPPPLPQPPPAVEDTEPARADPRVQRHVVSLIAFAGQERLRLQKLEVDLDKVEPAVGGGLYLWINPWAGIIASGSGIYHEFHGDMKQESVFGSEAVAVKAARWGTDLTLGWNVLYGWGPPSWQVTIGPTGAAAQLPALDVDYDPSAGNIPKPRTEAATLVGGAVSIGYFGSQFSLVATGGSAREQGDEEAIVDWQQVVSTWSFTERWALQIGALNRLTTLTKCSESEATCLAVGKSRSTSFERGLLVGSGIALR